MLIALLNHSNLFSTYNTDKVNKYDKSGDGTKLDRAIGGHYPALDLKIDLGKLS